MRVKEETWDFFSLLNSVFLNERTRPNLLEGLSERGRRKGRGKRRRRKKGGNGGSFLLNPVMFFCLLPMLACNLVLVLAQWYEMMVLRKESQTGKRVSKKDGNSSSAGYRACSRNSKAIQFANFGCICLDFFPCCCEHAHWTRWNTDDGERKTQRAAITNWAWNQWHYQWVIEAQGLFSMIDLTARSNCSPQ